jgi:hypothetical protein
MTTLLMVTLHDLTHMPELLEAWKRIGVPGVTILNSMGGFQASELVRSKGLGGFLKMFEEVRSGQRTLFSLIDDPELLELAISEADRIVKGFDRPQSGILFTLPIGQVLGLKKWGQERQESETEDGEIPPEEDRAKSNLLGWLQDDLEARYGEGALKDWSAQRSKPVSKILRKPAQKPVVVQMDNTLQAVLQGFLGDPDACFACVVNSEERLMGIIESQQLADVMFIQVMPEEYINDPQGYEMVLQHADKEQMPVAADIMVDPVFVQSDDTVEKTYHLLKEHHLSGMPVVDKNYRIEGYVTLLDLMAACFGEEEE